MQKLQQSVSKSLQLFASTDAPQPVSDADEIIQQLKEKFQNCATKSEQVQVLTVLPKSWSVRKVEQEFGPFGATNFMIRKAKKLVSEKGILSTPNPQKYPFPAEITESVTSFYKSEDIHVSRVMPGIKDYILVQKDGHRIQEQKYLVLCNLKEAFQRYKSTFPDKKISFSKFASLRPKECVLAGASGTHSVCVCTIHQNVKLMIHGSKLGHLTEEHTSRLNGYKECLSRITCSLAGPACFLGECEKCALLDTFRDEDGEFVVVADFSEYYSFVLQDAAQGFHWNNAQATLHPFVCYYKSGEKLEHISFVIISDCLHNDTVAVHLYQKHLISFLRSHFGSLPKCMVYFSDGCSSQYKNCKNFLNLTHHEDDFGMPAEWHFFATSHGKGPSDGVGGSVKRSAARASLQRPYHDQIMTPRQLFEYAKANITAVHFHYSTKEEYDTETLQLEARLSHARTIPEEDLVFDDIKGFVTVMYDNKWYLACVLQTFPSTVEVKLSCLEPAGPSSSFVYPRKADILIIPATNVLTIVDPATTTGRTYTLSEAECSIASQKLQVKLSTA
ncbi:hypothetical protein EMCRGX_G010065 [Ephydatia muelleri]